MWCVSACVASQSVCGCQCMCVVSVCSVSACVVSQSVCVGGVVSVHVCVLCISACVVCQYMCVCVGIYDQYCDVSQGSADVCV